MEGYLSGCAVLPHIKFSHRESEGHTQSHSANDHENGTEADLEHRAKRTTMTGQTLEYPQIATRPN